MDWAANWAGNWAELQIGLEMGLSCKLGINVGLGLGSVSMVVHHPASAPLSKVFIAVLPLHTEFNKAVIAAMAEFKMPTCSSYRLPLTFSSSFSLSSLSFSARQTLPPLKNLTVKPRRTGLLRIYAFSSNDIKVGSNIETDGAPWKVIEFLHVKPGKGAAYVRTTLRNYVTGNTVEKTFRAGSKIEAADINKETKQYTYKDGDQYVFMDLTTYEESRLNAADVGDKSKWLKEGMDCILLYWKDKIIDFDLPINVKLKVVDVDPGLRGDTASGGGSKPATLETGAVVNVPLFVNIGQEIIVDTRSGQYMSRVS